jgi:hypothetical protein
MPPEIPDLPDDYTTDADRADHTTTWIAGAILLAVAVAAAILIGAFA